MSQLPPKFPSGEFPASKRRARQRLGEMLLQAGVINQAKLDQALSMAKRTGDLLGNVLVSNGYVRPEVIARTLAAQFELPFLEPTQLHIDLVDRAAVLKVGVKLLQKHKLLPLLARGKSMLLLADPLATEGTDKVDELLGKRAYVVTTTSAIEMILQVIAFETVDAERIIESARDSIEAGEVKELFQYILAKAVLAKASRCAHRADSDHDSCALSH